jgi:hypothetical protein
MRETVKVRLVAGSVVVSLPSRVLEPLALAPGDRVILEALPPRRIILTKEGAPVPSLQLLELEIEVLEKKMKAIESDRRYKAEQYESNMPTDEGMEDPAVAILILRGLERDRDQLDVDIAEKRLQLLQIQGRESRHT